MVDLLDRKLVFVTGKGGVGKTTISAALGLLAASKGKRTLLCEMDAKGDLASSFETSRTTFEEREVAPNLWVMSMDTEASLRQYLSLQLNGEGGVHRPAGQDVRLCRFGRAGCARDRHGRQAVLGGPGAPLRHRRRGCRRQRPHHRPAGRPAGYKPAGPGRAHSPADRLDARYPLRRENLGSSGRHDS